MVSYVFVFWAVVIVMAAVGMIRGWAKEVLVSFAAVTALFCFKLIALVPPEFVSFTELAGQFGARIGFFLAIVFFGYQTPRASQYLGVASARDTMRDSALGVVFGALNGYLIAGSLWSFLDDAGYPVALLISPHEAQTLAVAGPLGERMAELAAQALNYLQFMPPEYLLAGPLIYFIMAAAFVFVLIVFI